MKKSLTVPLLCVIFAGCGDSNSPKTATEELTLLSYLTPCYTVSQTLCLATQNRNDETITPFYGSIQNWSFKWGESTKLQITLDSKSSAPDSGNTYLLNTVVYQVEDEVGTEYFYENVDLLSETFTKNGDQFMFLGHPFTCKDKLHCDQLLDINNSGGIVNLYFRYIGDNSIELTNWN